MSEFKNKRWKRNIFTGIYSRDSIRIIPEPHGTEGLAHYYREGRHFIVNYWISGDNNFWWVLNKDDIFEIMSDGSKNTVSEAEKQFIVDDICRATSDVWGKNSTT